MSGLPLTALPSSSVGGNKRQHHTAHNTPTTQLLKKKKVIAEVEGGLQGWVAKDRWRELGIRDQVAGEKGLKWAY